MLKAISRSPIVIREIAALGEDLKRGVRNVKEVVIFDEEELTEEVVQARVKATVTKTDTLVKHQKKAAQIEEKQAAISPGNKAKVKEARRLRWSLGRERVFISRIVRELKYTALERKRLLDKVNKTVDTMRTLDRQIRSLDQKYEGIQLEHCSAVTEVKSQSGYRLASSAGSILVEKLVRLHAPRRRRIHSLLPASRRACGVETRFSTPASIVCIRPATRTMKNWSRLELRIERNFTRFASRGLPVSRLLPAHAALKLQMAEFPIDVKRGVIQFWNSHGRGASAVMLIPF